MVIFPLLREKINVLVNILGVGINEKAYFVILDKVGGIDEPFNVISPISLRAISFLIDKILNSLAYSFLDLIFVEESFNFKAF